MTYHQAIRYIESFINYELLSPRRYSPSFQLARFADFLHSIGDPQKGLRCIHVAGSKGKGSTCAFIAYIVREAGFKVGLYTSPHLSDFRERIRILSPNSKDKSDFEGMISREDVAGLITRIKPAIARYHTHSARGKLSFFEIDTALAFIYFKEQRIDFAVLETGLGGRLDATNVVDSLVGVITPISYEHTQLLGNTLRKIAGEKAGIIKPGTSAVISAPQPHEARSVIRGQCRRAGARLYEIKKVRGKVSLRGDHQLINAGAAVAAVEALQEYGVHIGKDAIHRGLISTRWPGRCEVISRNPAMVVDGAQNRASAHALKEAILGNFKYDKLILVLGVSSDKDIRGICRELCPLADTVIVTQSCNPRAAKVEDLAEIIGRSVIKTESVKEAKAKAFALAQKNDLIIAAGSLFVVGEFRG